MEMNKGRGEKMKELFYGCKRGDLAKVMHLCEEEELDLNIRDKWDSTPLYYACLCGHEDLVEYLLQNGATCQENTFDGERCLYSALTQKIKEMLKNFKAITKDCIRRDSYVEFFKMLHSSQMYKDICFIIHGKHIFAHKVILAARCDYFAKMFENKWKNKKYITIKNILVSPSAFALIIQYIYTDRIELPVEEIEDFRRLIRQCQLRRLTDKLNSTLKSYYSYANTKPNAKQKVSVLSIQPEFNSSDLNDSYVLLTRSCLPWYFSNQQYPDYLPDIFQIQLPENEDGTNDYLLTEEIPAYADMCFNVEGYHFYGHQLFFCGRSEYFKSLCSFSKRSSETSTKSDMISLTLFDVSAEAFAIILVFIYTGSALIHEDFIYEVLHFAAMYLLPSLKKDCARKLKLLVDHKSVFKIYEISRLYELEHLESYCCEYMAADIEKVIREPAFISLIVKDADEIRHREETDSIPIIDDIRFHINKTELPGFLLDQSSNGSIETSTEMKLRLIEELLEELGLDA